MFEMIKKKMETKKQIKKAIKKAGLPIWWATYELVDGTHGTIRVDANSESKARKLATKRLIEVYGSKFSEIISTSCI